MHSCSTQSMQEKVELNISAYYMHINTNWGAFTSSINKLVHQDSNEPALEIFMDLKKQSCQHGSFSLNTSWAACMHTRAMHKSVHLQGDIYKSLVGQTVSFTNLLSVLRIFKLKSEFNRPPINIEYMRLPSKQRHFLLQLAGLIII